MRRTGKIGLMAGSLLIFTACNKASPLPRGASDIQQSALEAPSTESKSDRPSETGEGLPGYLIDPAKLAIESQNMIWTVTGSAAAVRHVQGEAASLNVLLIKVPKRSAAFDKQNQSWQLTGTAIASVQADALGAFKIQGSLTADDLLFVKLEDKAGPQIQYKAGTLATSVLWIEGTTARPIDNVSASEISRQVSSAQDLARLVEQVKSTGQCRNCNLAGADLSNLDIAACDLSFSNLMGVKFVLSNLSSCNLTNSNVSQADFSQANLSGANLTQADIAGANFSGANTEGVIGASIPAK